RHRTPRRVGDQQADRLGTVTWRMDRPNEQLAEVQLLAILERIEWEAHVRPFAQPEARTSGSAQLSVAGHVVGVQVRVYHVGNAIVALLGQVQVRLDVQLWIDDGRLTTLARRQKVRGAAGLVVQELLEIHTASEPPVGCNMVPQRGPVQEICAEGDVVRLRWVGAACFLSRSDLACLPAAGGAGAGGAGGLPGPVQPGAA